MKGIYGTKVGMTQIFAEDGRWMPVTVLETGPNIVQQVKSELSDGYDAVQIGFGQQKTQRANKATVGHCAKAQKGIPRFIGEIRLNEQNGALTKGKLTTEYKVGDAITVDGMFEVGKTVDVVGTSLGKGFAGVMKRHLMSGYKATHGTHEYFRHGGSIGCRKYPGRVFKNKRMPGRMGGERVLQMGLEVVKIMAEKNLLLVKGTVPGPKGGMIFVRQAIKG